MKKVYSLFIICTVFICTLSFCPVSAFQEDSFTDSQYEQIGSLGLGHLISDGQIDELDFSGGTGQVGFLIALGKSIVTKDPTYILEYGLNWATAKAQEILQSLEDWFSLNFPDLYEFFTGVKTEIKYSPMPLETRRGFTQLLKDRVEEEEPITPTPNDNYLIYIELLNGKSRNVTGFQSDFFFGNYDRTSSLTEGYGSYDADPNNYSFVAFNRTYDPSYYNDSYYAYYNISFYIDDRYRMSKFYTSEPITIYINQVEGTNTYIMTSSNFDFKKPFYYDGTSYFDGSLSYNPGNGKYWLTPGNITSYPTVQSFQYTGSLTNCFKVLCINFRNVDVVVNGDIWALGNFSSDDSIIYPIGLPDNFEILSGVQGGYYYPPDSYWNLDGLVQLIKQAITEYGIISISDIAPLIVDINGVQAVRTTNVARTDYDNLISEQYSVYPGDDVLQVPSVVLDNGEIISFVASSSGSDLIPDDIMLVLCAGGLLLLIGYMINRMLE